MKHWIQATRLRTLPLSVSGILVGSSYAFYKGFENNLLFILAILTTLSLQILSNFANDYGDGIKGTDNENRIGPKRAVQSGNISKNTMKNGIFITVLITLALAISLIYVSFGYKNLSYSLFFLGLGIAAIVAALKYTIGNSAYGYRGLGDIFVFVFFGLVSVLGSNFLFTKTFYFWLLVPAIAIGLLSVAVLNLNNMRDIENDKNSNKNTIVVKIGFEKAKNYHFFLITIALLLLYIFGLSLTLKNIVLILVGYIMVKHLKFVKEVTQPKTLDTELKKVALFTFLVSIILSISMLF